MACADSFVNQLLEKDTQVIAEIMEIFPSACHGAKINRPALGKIIFSDAEKRKKLEKILHPRVRELEKKFVQKQKRLGAKIVVLDIPLLFETHGEKRVDWTIVATAPYFIQKRRVMARPNMNEEKFRQILARQMPDRMKRKKADFVIPTGLGKAYSFRLLKGLFQRLQ